MIVEPGDLIPADGEVISGAASVNEAAITGESAPVIREAGGDRSAVTAGTRLLAGSIAVPLLVALFITLIPTTIAGLLSAIGIAGINRLVRFNVLAKSGRAVEAAGDVDTLLIDKTGTIMVGDRQATEFVAVPGVPRARLIAAVLSAIIFNALIIPALVPLALKGVRYKPAPAAELLTRNLAVYGLGGLIVPFIGIKAIDLIVNALNLI